MADSTTNWPGLELRHLQALVAVAEAGTFGRAAERLGYTQSAVSQQVAALERVVGTDVFDRPGGPRPVRITEAGEVLLAHAHDVLARLRGAEADVRAVVAGDGGRLRVGVFQSVGTKVLPALLRRLASERPGLEIQLTELHEDHVLLDLVGQGELDITFCALPAPDGPWVTRHVLDDPFVVLAPTDSPLATAPTASVDEAAAFPLIGNRGATCHFAIETALAEASPPPRFVFFTDDNSTMQGCVGAGLAHAVVPLLTVDVDDPATVVVSLDPPVAPRRLALAWHGERRPSVALDAFVAATEAVCGELLASV